MIIRPTTVERGIAFDIMSALEHRGFLPCAFKLMAINEDQAKKFYEDHKGKPFYDEIIADLLAGQSFVAAFGVSDKSRSFNYALRGGWGWGSQDPHFNGSVLSRFSATAESSRGMVHTNGGEAMDIFFSPTDHVINHTGS